MRNIQLAFKHMDQTVHYAEDSETPYNVLKSVDDQLNRFGLEVVMIEPEHDGGRDYHWRIEYTHTDMILQEPNPHGSSQPCLLTKCNTLYQSIAQRNGMMTVAEVQEAIENGRSVHTNFSIFSLVRVRNCS